MGPDTVDYIEEFFRVNVEKKLFIKVPDQEEHDLTPATRLLEKRREMMEVENGLAQQKEDFAMKMESLSQRRDELARKEAQLKESLVKFDKFLKESDAKRNRAIKKAVDEQRTRTQKEVEIVQLKDQQGDLSSKKGRSTHIMYQKFLESILETADEFGEVKDILSRFDTLSATNQELLGRARDAQEKTEGDRARLGKIIEACLLITEKNNLVLNYNNEIARLQTCLEESKLRTTRQQQEWDAALRSASAKTLLLGQIKMYGGPSPTDSTALFQLTVISFCLLVWVRGSFRATNNLFSLVKGHLNSRVSSAADPLVQLEKIHQFIV
ncbi:Cilia- and flagella-associated protein 73, partial [Cladochytrium tenue]